MWEEGIVHVLEEEGRRVEGVEGDAVGELDEVELLFLREDVFNVGLELGVFFEHFGADCALRTRFHFRLRAGRDADRVSSAVVCCLGAEHTLS